MLYEEFWWYTEKRDSDGDERIKNDDFNLIKSVEELSRSWREAQLKNSWL